MFQLTDKSFILSLMHVASNIHPNWCSSFVYTPQYSSLTRFQKCQILVFSKEVSFKSDKKKKMFIFISNYPAEVLCSPEALTHSCSMSDWGNVFHRPLNRQNTSLNSSHYHSLKGIHRVLQSRFFYLL